MVDEKVCLVSVVSKNFEQRFEVSVSNSISIGEELIKFICYLDDYKMVEYFRDIIKAGQFNFNDAFFVTRLRTHTNVREVHKEDKKYVYEYLIDLDLEYLHFTTISKDGLHRTSAITFERLSDYPHNSMENFI